MRSATSSKPGVPRRLIAILLSIAPLATTPVRDRTPAILSLHKVMSARKATRYTAGRRIVAPTREREDLSPSGRFDSSAGVGERVRSLDVRCQLVQSRPWSPGVNNHRFEFRKGRNVGHLASHLKTFGELTWVLPRRALLARCEGRHRDSARGSHAASRVITCLVPGSR